MSDQELDNETDVQQESSETPPVILGTEALFGDLKEIWIEHNGERYRLRITRKNKLILQK
jgi:hemin uptake protein HemP